MAHSAKHDPYPRLPMIRTRSTLFNLLSLFLLVLLPACTIPVVTTVPTPAATAGLAAPIFLSASSPVSASMGYGRLGVGVYGVPENALEGQPLNAHGLDWPHGLMMHAPALVQYALDGQYRLLRATLLLQDGIDCGDGVRFKVQLDGRAVYASPVVLSAGAPLGIELDVTGAQTLSLQVDPQDTTDCDWAIWGDPALVPPAGVPVGYPTATAQPSPTPNPDLPCGGVLPERTYLFLDCSDIRRIRADLAGGDPGLLGAWNAMVSISENYRENFPTTFNPDASAPTLWWGNGNEIAANLAAMYLVTGDRAYARDILRLLNLVVQNTPSYPTLTRFNEPSSGGMLYSGGLLSHPRYGEGPFQSLLFAYFAIREDAFLDDTQRDAYDAFFRNQAGLLEHAAIVQGNFTPLDGRDNRNVPAGANLSALTIAAAFPDDLQMQALAARVRPVFEDQMAAWWEPDGGWGEHTNQYGYRLFRAILYYAETLLQNGGGDLYQAEYDGISMHALCGFWLNVLTPEGDPPSINDTGFGYFDPGTLMQCAKRTNDPQFSFAAAGYLWGIRNAYGLKYGNDVSPLDTVLWWDPSVPAVSQPPDGTSVLLPDTGLGIFRSDWTHEAQYALLKYTASLVHAHFSFGEFFLYDHGPWLIGSGYHLGESYDLSVATRSASTLTLDDSRQAQPGGTLVAFEPFNQTGYMAVTARSYVNLDHTRSVLWMPAYHQWLVVDDAVMADPIGHKLQVRWFVRGQGAGGDGNGNWTFTRPDHPGTLSIQMPTLENARIFAIERSFETDPGDANGVEIEVRAQPVTRILTSLAYSNESPAGFPLVQRDDSGDGLRITTQAAPGTPLWEWLLSVPGAGSATSDALHVDGRVGCTWTISSVLDGYCLYDGGGLVSGALHLVESSVPLSLEADFAGNTIALNAGAETRLRVYWPVDVASITEDGKAVPFQQSDGLLFLELAGGNHTLVITGK